MVVLQAPMSILFAWAVWPVRPRAKIVVVVACTVIFLGICVVSHRLFYSPCGVWNPGVKSLSAMERALAPHSKGVGGTDEYATPPGARNDLVAIGLPDACLVRDPYKVLSNVPAGTVLSFYIPPAWSPELDTCEDTFAATPKSRPEHLRVAANLDQPGYLILRLRSYPDWLVKVNGTPVTNLPHRKDGLIAVPVPKGTAYLTVDWVNSPDILLGRWLTIAGIFLLAALWLLEHRLSTSYRNQSV